MKKEVKLLFRVTDGLYVGSYCDENETSIGPSMTKIFYNEYQIIKETPKGYWILDFNERKWVSKVTKKRFAYPTKEDALTNYKYRKLAAIKILKHKIGIQELFYDMAEKGETQSYYLNKFA